MDEQIVENRFEEFKDEILVRAKKANACVCQYKRAYMAETIDEICNVIKDNFTWCCRTKVLDISLFDKYKDELSQNQIYYNKDVEKGYLLAFGSARIEAYGNATVYAYDNARVEAYGNATVYAYDNATVYARNSVPVYARNSATVYAYDNATVYAHNSATVYAYDNARVEAYGNATVYAYGSVTVYAYDSVTVYARNSATVKAYDNSYIQSYTEISCKLSDNAIYRVIYDNVVYSANNNVKFKQQLRYGITNSRRIAQENQEPTRGYTDIPCNRQDKRRRVG